jgi:predicted DNA-binding protein (UPF0251 family)
MIKDEIITYEEIYQMIIISQKRDMSFLTSTTKCELLLKMSNLSYLDKIKTTCLHDMNCYKKDITQIIKKSINMLSDLKITIKSDKNYKKMVSDSQNKLYEIKEKYENEKEIIKKEYDNINTKYIENQNELIRYEERLKLLNDKKNSEINLEELEDIDELEEKNIEYEKILKKINIDKNNIYKKMTNHKKKIQTLTNKLENNESYKNIEIKYKQFENKKNTDIKKIDNEIIKLLKNIKPITKTITKSLYNTSNTKICSITLQIDKLKELLEQSKKIKQKNIKDITNNYKIYLNTNTELNKLKKYIEVYDDIYNIINLTKPTKQNTIIKNINKRCDDEKTKILTQISLLEKDVLNMLVYEEEYENYNQHQNQHQNQNDLYEELNKLEIEKNELMKNIENYDNNIINNNFNNNLNKEIDILKNKKKDIEKSKLDEYDEYLEIIEKYKTNY